jgi:hypothetical protein
MPGADPSVAWGTYFVALGVIVAVSFLVTYLATDVARMARALYVGLLAVVTGAMTWAYLWATGTDPVEFLGSGWAWGLLGAVVAGAITCFQARRWPALGTPSGPVLAGRLVWEGLVYGATEGTLLSILPVLAVWQGGTALGWTDAWPGKIGVGALAMAASVAVIAIHHLGYREFRGAAMRYPVIACAVFSMAYLLTGSVLAAIGGHAALHVVAVIGGTELPPRRAVRPGQPTRERLARAAASSDLITVRGVSQMARPITVEQYEQAELQMQTEGARRGFLIHAAIYVAVQAGLITINLVVAPDFL